METLEILQKKRNAHRKRVRKLIERVDEIKDPTQDAQDYIQMYIDELQHLKEAIKTFDGEIEQLMGIDYYQDEFDEAADFMMELNFDIRKINDFINSNNRNNLTSNRKNDKHKQYSHTGTVLLLLVVI